MNKGIWRRFLFGSIFILSSVVTLAGMSTVKPTEPPRADPLVPQIIPGVPASPGEFPWVVEIDRCGPTGVCRHSCAGTLLSSNYVLTAAHCVDGALAASIRVWAGFSCRSAKASLPQNIHMRMVSNYTVHQNYLVGCGTYPNDIAILTLAQPYTLGGLIQAATLPADNSNNYAGVTSVIVGWGRTSVSNVLPDCLQKASIPVITTAEANALVSPVAGALVCDNHMALYDPANNSTFCNGDNGGPVNTPDGVTRVSGIVSWGISSGGNCLPSYPAVTTRVSAYLPWIADNTP